MSEKTNPLQFDWGGIFVESYNTITKNATVIYNFNFDTKDDYGDFLNYSVSHIYTVQKNIPPESSITVIYELRGSAISDSIINEFSQRVKCSLSTDSLLDLKITYNR